MTASELRELTAEELARKGSELRSELMSVKVRHSTGQLENTAKLEQLRREVARVETILRAKREGSQ